MRLSKRQPGIFLVCTGLGKVSRGFENYMAALSSNLGRAKGMAGSVQLFAGGNYRGGQQKVVNIPCISNTCWLSRNVLREHYGYILEQVSFFLFFFPVVLIKRPAVIYLGEYRQFCYLFKARKYLRLSFSLALYTGGQVYPGLFDPGKDFVHHVTHVYLDEMRKRAHSESRQYLVPHFIGTNFKYNAGKIAAIRKNAQGKKIVLSVGLIDRRIKRMDFLVEQLHAFPGEIYPVILGQFGPDTGLIKTLLDAYFGAGNYLLDCVSAEDTGNYYKAADLFILCSLKESFGLVLLEALSHDLPVMCHPFDEGRFILQEQAIFIDMESACSLQAGLQQWYDGNFKTTSGHWYVQEHYSWQALEGKYVAMFNSFVAA